MCRWTPLQLSKSGYLRATRFLQVGTTSLPVQLLRCDALGLRVVCETWF